MALSSVHNVCISCGNKSLSHCKHCLSGKMHQFSFPISNFHASKPLELVHSDVWVQLLSNLLMTFNIIFFLLMHIANLPGSIFLNTNKMFLIFLSFLKHL